MATLSAEQLYNYSCAVTGLPELAFSNLTEGERLAWEKESQKSTSAEIATDNLALSMHMERYKW